MRPGAAAASRFAVLGVLLCAACSGTAQGGAKGVGPSTTLNQLFNSEAFFQRLGRLATGEPLPFTGSIAFLKGAGDSSIAVLALSLPSRDIAFQREPGGFSGRYRVDVQWQRDGVPTTTSGEERTVRVASFKETLRQDESILYQKAFRLLPGTYRAVVTVRDPASGNVSQAQAGVVVPAFGARSTTAPVLAYQAAGRGAPGDPPTVVLNPRGTVAYGGDSLLAYVEGYGFGGPTAVPFQVRTGRDSVIYQDTLRFLGGRPVESQAVHIRPANLALGELTLAVGDGPAAPKTVALVSFSQDVVLTDFDEMLSLLRFFGADRQVKALREAPPSERGRLWREFWVATDPNRATPENEALDSYFARIAIANRRFRDEGTAGWRTDRGEVFVALGEPDEALESAPVAAGTQGRVVRWTYVNYRLALFFQDRGFGRLRLTPQSRGEFERLLLRLRRTPGT